MRLDGVLFTASAYISHPLLDRLFGGSLPAAGDHDGSLGDYRLVVVDARQPGDALAEGGIAQRALQAGVAVLVLAPNQGQMADVTRIVGSGPHSPAQAVFITSARRGNGLRYDVKVLGYPALAGWDGKDRQPPRLAVGQDHVLSDFAIQVESGAERGAKAMALEQFPDGLRWFMTTWGITMGLNYQTTGEETFKNSGASFTLSYTIWAFLSESPSATNTEVIAEGTLTLNPGTLASNDEEARAVMNMWLKSSLQPWQGSVSASGTGHIPTSGIDSWSESFEIPISYRDPFGGYDIYTFTADVAQTIPSWSVQNVSNGKDEGSQWYVNSPIDGLTFPEGRSGAFNGSGHVEPFPAACTGRLTVDEASAWSIGGAVNGTLRFKTLTYFNDVSIYGTNCGLAFCYDPESEYGGYGTEIQFEINIVYA